jgi:hypothetical protein
METSAPAQDLVGVIRHIGAVGTGSGQPTKKAELAGRDALEG